MNTPHATSMERRPLTLAQVADALDQQHLLLDLDGDPEIPLLNATDDSRAVAPGSLFCAIAGERIDARTLIPDAHAAGAAAVMLQGDTAVPPGLPVLRVSDDRRAAGVVAELAAGFPARHFRTFAITGTNGKTTSAYLLRHVLQSCGLRTAMLGTVEYDLGNGQKMPASRTTPTPFALQKLFQDIYSNGCEACVMELSSHALHQQRIGTMAFDGAIFTNLTQDHLDYHHTLENYFQAKKRLFTHHLKPGAPAVINADDDFGARLARELTHNLAERQTVSFSLKNLCAPVCVHVKDLKLSATGTECALTFPDGTWSMASPLAGLYNGYNLAGVAILAHELGLPRPTVQQALATCLAAPGRLQKLPCDRPFAIFVDYAHTPDALSNVLNCLRTLIPPPARLIAVFGCGGDRDRTKRPQMGAIAAALADLAIVTSDNPRSEPPERILDDILAGIPTPAPHPVLRQADRAQAIRDAIHAARPGDCILIAGKGHEDYQEINGVKHPFSDAACVADILGE